MSEAPSLIESVAHGFDQLFVRLKTMLKLPDTADQSLVEARDGCTLIAAKAIDQTAGDDGTANESGSADGTDATGTEGAGARRSAGAGILTRGAGRIASTLNREARTVEGVAVSGFAPTIRDPRRGDPDPASNGLPWVEEIDPAGADLAAFRGLPLLLDHQATTRAAVGTVPGARLEGGQVVVGLAFDPTPTADVAMTQVETGSVRGLSIGYRTLRRAKVGTTPAGLPVFRAVSWTPLEVSLTPLPVDAGATIRGARMTTFSPQADTNRAIRSIAGLAGLDQAWVDGQIDAGATADQAREAAFSAMAQRSRTTIDNRPPAGQITVGADHTDPQVMRRSMADALAHRLAPGLLKLEGPAIQYRGLPALAMLGQLAAARGERLNPWDREGLLTRALGGGHTSSDFPLLLADAANKTLLAQYQAAAPSYRQIASQKSFNDFKAHNFLRLGDFPVFRPVAEAGTTFYGTLSENREQVKAKEFVTGLIIGRDALINDDLSALSDFSGLIATRSAQFENSTVYALLAGNGPTLSDGKALFHTGHANKAAVGTTLAAGIDAAVLAFRLQTGLDGAKINVSPKYLVVGPALEAAARRLLATINPVQAADVNPWAGQFTLIVDAEISGNRWYLFAEPAQVPTLVFGYVGGAQGPQIKTETDFDTQSVKVRAGLDFAAGAIDFRGVYLDEGA